MVLSLLVAVLFTPSVADPSEGCLGGPLEPRQHTIGAQTLEVQANLTQHKTSISQTSASASAKAAIGQCPSTASSLLEEIERTKWAFIAKDTRSFKKSMGGVEKSMRCLTELIARKQVTEIHLLMALRAYQQKDEYGTLNAFRSQLAIWPDVSLAEDLSPPGDRLREIFVESKSVINHETVPITLPEGWIAWADGLEVTERPFDRPWFAQLTDPKGVVRWSAYLSSGEDLPEPATLIKAANK